jgi:CIC family chloride channel protein
LQGTPVPGDHEAQASRSLTPLVLWLLSILVGIVAGLGAVVFRALIAFFHNLLFLGRLSWSYDANAHTPPSPWGAFVILAPLVGAAGVAFLVKNFAPEAKGHGVPEVMDAVYHRRGVIRPIVSVIKAFASALSIGSGGSIGREGPIIQIGSSFGSTMGQILRTPVWQRITLIAAGAGGGIGATFNTPVGGVLFALEMIMHEVSARTLVPVVTATATATYVGQLFFGPHPSFSIPAFETPFFEITAPVVLAAYAALGAMCGLVSALFIRSIYGFEHFFEKRIKGGYYVQHMLGMLMVGVMFYLMMLQFGHYYVEGVGYATIQDILTSVRFPVYLLVLLFLLKLAATSLTLGSGASGGVFSPALYMGATTGALYGVMLNRYVPSLHVSTAAFAVAGMAGVVGGSTGAALAAIVMIFEMTLDYTVIVPMTLTVAISYAVRRSLVKDSIYTRKLTLRGSPVPETLRADVPSGRRAQDIMHPHFRLVSSSESVRECPLPIPEDSTLVLVATAAGGVAGVMTSDGGRDGNVQTDYVVVTPDDSLWDVVTAMRSSNAGVALVAPRNGQLSANEVRGMITRKDILETVAGDMELFGH